MHTPVACASGTWRVFAPSHIANAGAPVITGTATENQTLTVNASGIADADGLGAFSYQWKRNGAAIKGATGTRYKLGKADRGKRITITVTAKRYGYTTGSATSKAKKIS